MAQNIFGICTVLRARYIAHKHLATGTHTERERQTMHESIRSLDIYSFFRSFHQNHPSTNTILNSMRVMLPRAWPASLDISNPKIKHINAHGSKFASNSITSFNESHNQLNE